MRKISGIIMVVVLLLMAVPDVSAQDSGKPTPIDSYPLPSEPGAARYSLADRWDHLNLTYYFNDCPSRVDCQRAQDTVRRAFQTWDDVSALVFSEAAIASAADIEIQWTSRAEELGSPGGVLAFAYFPSYGGDLYFDDAEQWTFGGGGTDLFITAVHEIGHTIGLDHTDDDSAVMFPYLLPLSGLGEDDIRGVQRLYGPNVATGNEPDVVAPATPDDLPGSNMVETVEGQITDARYYDLWTIDAHAGETVVITAETLNGDLDIYLGLMTPDQRTVLAEDDDSLGGTNAQITYTFPTSDNYVIITTRYGLDAGNTRGAYRLTAYRNAAAVPTATPTPTTAKLVISNTSGVTLCGIWISPSSSQDWGSDWLPSAGVNRLENNQRVLWEVQPEAYDILVADCSGHTLEAYLVNVVADTEVQVFVYQDRLAVQ